MPKQKRIGKASRVVRRRNERRSPNLRRRTTTERRARLATGRRIVWIGREGIEHVGIYYMVLPSNASPPQGTGRPNYSFPFRTPKPNAADLPVTYTRRRSATRNLPSYRG